MVGISLLRGTKIAIFWGAMKTHTTYSGFMDERGFSLVELMVVIGIIIMAAVIGVPAYNMTIKPTAELKSAASRLYADIQDARMRSIKENVRHGLAFYSTPDRYTVFVDNGPVNGQYDAGEQIIKTRVLADEFNKVEFDTGCGACGGDGITLANDAFAMTTRALASTSGTIYLKNKKNEGRSVTVSTMGNVQIAVYTP
jgi:prepilin-type N-terminal cleavage/methylation domain-containing protein